MAQALKARSGWRGPREGRARRAYETVRKQVLERDRGICQIGLAGYCIGIANTVDHIRPISEGGAVFDPANLRAACHPCNTRLGAILGGRKLAMSQQRHSRVW